MTTFEEMQRGELDWWIQFLREPHAIARLFGVYGYRYLPFFFEEFNNLGTVVDFGSGPVSAAYIGEPAPKNLFCVDPLMAEYHRHGLVYGTPITEWDTLPQIFDTALLLNVLDHCEEPQNLIREAARSLVSGGAALIWVHVGLEADTLHRPVHTPDVVQWLRDADLNIDRVLLRQDFGPLQYMAKAVKR